MNNASSNAAFSRGVASIPGTEARLWLDSAAIAPDRRQVNPAHLTPRQVEVLVLLCEGLPNKLICRRLNIAAGTVKVHISCILRELGVTSRLQAVVAARRHDLAGVYGAGASGETHTAG